MFHFITTFTRLCLFCSVPIPLSAPFPASKHNLKNQISMVYLINTTGLCFPPTDFKWLKADIKGKGRIGHRSSSNGEIREVPEAIPTKAECKEGEK